MPKAGPFETSDARTPKVIKQCPLLDMPAPILPHAQTHTQIHTHTHSLKRKGSQAVSAVRRPRHVDLCELEPAWSTERVSDSQGYTEKPCGGGVPMPCGSPLGELVPLQALSPITASCPRRPRTRSSGGTTEARGVEKRKLSQKRRTLVSAALLEPSLSPATTRLLPAAH